MRLFAAVTPPAGALDHLAAAVSAVRDDRPGLRWSGREQWHITLAFYGELPAGRVPGLERRLARAAARVPPLDLALTGAGAFPGSARARVLWAGVGGDLRGLRHLAGAAAAAGRRAGAEPDRKAYRPHLTLARCRTPADLTGLVTALGGLDGEPWRAGELELIHSRPGPRPSYATVRTWPLAGSAK